MNRPWVGTAYGPTADIELPLWGTRGAFDLDY